MPITLPVEATADDRSFNQVADRAKQRFARAGQESGKAFTKGLDDAASKADPKSVDRWSKAYDKVADSTGRVRVEESKLADLRNRGANNTRLIAQSEALERARRAEARATREARNAYKEYEDSASSGSLGSRFQQAGQNAADSFGSGFAGASALTRLAAATGPIGLALSGIAALGFVAGRKLVEQLEMGMATLQMKDTFAARMGVDNATMERFGAAAGRAYVNAWGASVEENLQYAQFAVQGGLIDADATDVEIQQVIEQMQTVTTLIGEDGQAIARGLRNVVKAGVADSTTEAMDLVVAASQRGLNISGDLLDTLEEYSTKFRDLGLDGQEALGLINQMWVGGIRNVDVAADALKEFSISVVDGSKSTAEAMAALGFNAEDMANRFAQGGPVARQAFGEVLDALRGIEDPMQRQLITTALFKTKWEDAGDAIRNADLDTAASQLGDVEGATQRAAEKVGEHASSWGELGRQIDLTFTSLREWLADSTIGRFFTQGLPGFLTTLASPPQAAFGSSQSYNGQQIAPAIPGATGGIAPPSTGAITGNGTFLDSVLNGVPGLPAPDGLGGSGASAGPGPTRTTPVPMVPDSAGGGGAGSSKPNIPLSAYSLDSIPLGGFQGETGVAMPGIQMPAQTGPGYFDVDQGRIFDAETRRLSAANSVEQARRRVLELQADNDTTESELNAAKQSVVQAERGYVSAQMAVAEAQQGTWKKLEDKAQSFADGMGEIGAAIDADFGVSDGLAGIAENITKFLAGLAFAPVVGALRGVQAGAGFPNGSGGSGLAGMIGGALGMGGSAGSGGSGYYSAATGGGGYYPSGYQPAMSPSGAMPTGISQGGAYGLPAGANISYGEKGFPDWVYQLGKMFNLQASTYGGHQESSRPDIGALPNPGGMNRGIDWAGSPSDLSRFAEFLQQTGMAEQVIYRNPQTGQTYGYPFNVDYSGDYGGHGNHLHSRFGASPVLSNATRGGGYSNLTGSQLTSPSLMTPIPTTGGGIGSGAGFPGMAGPAQSTIGGITPAGGRGEGGLGVAGGLLGMATNALGAAAGAGGMAANAMAPGAGAAISAATDIGIKLINRTAQWGGQAAGIGVGGLLEAFLPVESSLADPMNSWFGRIVGGMMGAVPSLPNTAGQAAAAPQNGQNGQNGQPTDGRPPINVTYNNNQATEDRAGADLTNHLMAMNSGPGQ